MLIGSLFVLPGTQSQLNLERSKSRMGTFVEGGPTAEPNPDEGYGMRGMWGLSDKRAQWNTPGSHAVVSCRTSSDMPDVLSRRKLKPSPSDQDLPWPDWSILPSSSSSLGWFETSCIIAGPAVVVVVMRSKVINISQTSTSIVSEVLSYPCHKHLLSPLCAAHLITTQCSHPAIKKLLWLLCDEESPHALFSSSAPVWLDQEQN